MLIVYLLQLITRVGKHCLLVLKLVTLALVAHLLDLLLLIVVLVVFLYLDRVSRLCAEHWSYVILNDAVLLVRKLGGLYLSSSILSVKGLPRLSVNR